MGALVEMKERGVVHRDIKPENVLVFSSEISKRFLQDKAYGNYLQLDIHEYLQTADLTPTPAYPNFYPFTYKICDTGLAKTLDQGESTSTQTGTVGYMPP